ncbi:purine-binding chemotaxis protein CheW [Fusibacter paucivorans]|uniref:Purine-binding chemotaxis protein CheW n=1 Tax=Fusibacter paucivorans TaxID=76009 RepID=A0ABS5PTH3_9FIRM|nr:chemotaxis protein CheW [Fusibacter paucivorans]MBS7527342.1 purine-binding chemotaxis protein CheW [Fusibacter paucivorans]
MADKQYIVFKLNGEKFAANINQIASITEFASITSLPNAPAYVEGLLNLRGDIIPVINLKKRFKMAYEGIDNQRILIARKGDIQIGFLVDDASQSMTVGEKNILPPPMIAIRKDNKYISEVAVYQDELIIVVDLERVLTDDEIDEIMDL